MPIHEMRPRPVVPRSFLKEADNLLHALQTLLAGDESAIDAHDQRHDTKSAGSRGYDVIIAGNIFEGRPGIRMRAVPVITKGFFLQHGQQFVVAEKMICIARRRADRFRLRTLAVPRVLSLNAVRHRLGVQPQIIGEARRAADLHSDGPKLCALFRAINDVALDLGRLRRSFPTLHQEVRIVPAQIDVPFITFSG